MAGTFVTPTNSFICATTERTNVQFKVVAKLSTHDVIFA
jgi:hypothetical protein